MIRKYSLLILVVLLFSYAAWTFYTEALSYDPLSTVASEKYTPSEDDVMMASEFKPAWSRQIHEKNLFSPSRSYKKMEPLPVVESHAGPPSRRPELVLKGIVLDTFGEYVAYIEIDRAKPKAMRKGDKIKNIEIADISGRKVVLKWKTETFNLGMDKIKTINNPRARK